VKKKSLIAWLGLDKPEETRACPHCEATIGVTENVCPRCRRILRFEGIAELGRNRSGKPGEAA
jgi:predicted amidophosphoribosyltransferase